MANRDGSALVRLDADLTGSNCGEDWFTVVLQMAQPDEMPDHRIREIVADHYAIPLSQVSYPRPWTDADDRVTADLGMDD